MPDVEMSHLQDGQSRLFPIAYCNTAVIIAGGGSSGGTARRSCSKEESMFTAGDSYPVFEGVPRSGINICYDTQHPQGRGQRWPLRERRYCWCRHRT